MQSPCHERGTSSKLLVGSCLRTSTAQTRPSFLFRAREFPVPNLGQIAILNCRRTCSCLNAGYARTVWGLSPVHARDSRTRVEAKEASYFGELRSARGVGRFCQHPP